MNLSFDRAVSQDQTAGLSREWLVTNGLGGYASGTVLGLNTRRYHGLLVAAIEPPVRRTALLVRLNEALTVGDETIELTTAEYGGQPIGPEGYRYLASFAMEDGLPNWSYAVGGSLLRRSVWMVPGRNVSIVRYKLAVGSAAVEIALRPLCAARDHHSTQHGNLEWRFAIDEVRDGIRLRATPDAPPLWLMARGATFIPAGDWYWNFQLREEQARGYDHIEDLYQPGTFRAVLRPGASLTLIASAEDPERDLPDPDVALAAIRSTYAHARVRGGAVRRPREQQEDVPALIVALTAAAEQFVVLRVPDQPAEPGSVSLLAGYHWFSDWGRDAMISLPGLLLGTGRLREAEAMLRAFAEHIDHGMIPNRFPDDGQPAEYNTADASLWFFQALRATLEAGAGEQLLADLYPRMREIVAWHQRGTRYSIGVDPADGLLRAGEAGPLPTQLTWMDARTEGTVFTPRVGKPVEINALWIAALDLMASWSPRHGDDSAPYLAAAARARASFAARFWYQAGGYLYDVVDGPEGDDPSLRPNQAIALGVADLSLSREQMASALAAITSELLTPYGLRTLASGDPRYRGICAGDQYTRDSAYHQGTVWPWLLGPYADALRRVHGDSAIIAPLLVPFHAHLREAGLGSVSEIFDGDAPHAPRGCIAQAWSVGELLRLARGLEAARG